MNNKGGGNAQIFSEKVEFDAAPKVDNYKADYKKPKTDVKVSFKIFILKKKQFSNFFYPF